MTDQTIRADKVRDARDLHRDAAKMTTITDAEREIHQHVADALQALLPALPTLADMTLDDRYECQRMQCDVAGVRGQWVLITPPGEGGLAGMIAPHGDICWFLPKRVTPRPDLPRLEWPARAPVPESTLAVASVWRDPEALARACEESGRDHIAVTDRDGGVSVWDARRDDWRGHYRAVPKYAPYTIIHAGKEADQ